MQEYNELKTLTNVEATIGADYNGPKAKRYWPNSYAYFIGMMMYL